MDRNLSQINDISLQENKTLPMNESSIFYEIDVPIMKVDCNDTVIEYNSSFLNLLDVNNEISLSKSCPLATLLKDHELLNTIVSVLDIVRQTSNGFIKDHHNGESFFRVKALTPEEDGSINLIIYDYTIQKRFENLLTFHDQMESVSHIAAGVAHELRNPLSVIKGFLQLAKLTNSYPKYYDTILSELNRMNGIIEDFLSVSRKKTDRKLQSPYIIIKSLVEIIKSECILHNITVNFQLESTTEQVDVNEAMIKQVILNILRNSLEAYHDEKGRQFLVKTYTSSSSYYIFLEDNGIGMSAEVLKQLGKPFFTTKEKGTGIGIPLCKKIIEEHGGTFDIASKINVGTTVKISLPYIR